MSDSGARAEYWREDPWAKVARLEAKAEQLKAAIAVADEIAEFYRRSAKEAYVKLEAAEREVGRLKAELASRQATPDAGLPTRARMACVRGGRVYVFTTDEAARDFMVATGNGWSFAAWVEGIVWDAAEPAAGEVKPWASGRDGTSSRAGR